MRALVVDDSRAIRSVLRRMLSEIGFDADEAGDGRQALTVLDRIPAPDVMLVDWNMPEMDGLALVQAIRAIPELDAVPVVMVDDGVRGRAGGRGPRGRRRRVLRETLHQGWAARQARAPRRHRPRLSP